MLVPPSDIPKIPVAQPAPGITTGGGRAPSPEAEVRHQGSTATPAEAAPAVEITDIRPLDLTGALRILLAEIRASFELSGSLAAGQDGPDSAPLDVGGRIARAAVQIALNAMPRADAGAAEWSILLPRIDATLAAGVERALAIVGNWREVPPSVLQAVRDTATLIQSALAEDALNPLWVRPEWAGLAPSLRRRARARRALKRRATDPDYWPTSLQDEESWHAGRSSTPQDR